MKPITTNEQAQMLPERPGTYVTTELQQDGSVLHLVLFRDLVAVESDDNAIIVFGDKDGRLMTIGYDSDGAYKYPFV